MTEKMEFIILLELNEIGFRNTMQMSHVTKVKVHKSTVLTFLLQT